MSTAAPFAYRAVDCWDEAIELLGTWGDEALVIAGGQSLVPMLTLRLANPTGLVDLNPIKAGEPTIDGDVLVVPAMTRQQQVLRSPVFREHVPLLVSAGGHVGNVRVRARGTVGGSLCHADATGEIPAVVLALGGQMVARGPGGRRVIEADDFFVTHLTTALTDGELLTEIRLPVRRPREGWAFHEMVRRVSDFATVAVAATVRVGEDLRTIEAVSVVLGAVADRPVALDAGLTAPLVGAAGSPDELAAVARAAAASVSPESDVHASGEYRRRLVDVLTRRALTDALERARNDQHEGRDR